MPRLARCGTLRMYLDSRALWQNSILDPALSLISKIHIKDIYEFSSLYQTAIDRDRRAYQRLGLIVVALRMDLNWTVQLS